jgi:putative flippase GtrA
VPESPPGSAPPSAPRRSGSVRRLSTYTAGSVIAAASSELTLLLCYGWLGLAPAWSSTIAWLAGALPNYWLNRRWVWGRRGRPDMTREVLPYVAIILGTVLLAALVTKGVDAWMRDAGVSGTTRTVAVAVAFLGVYVVMFLFRYFLLDRLFRPKAEREQGEATT